MNKRPSFAAAKPWVLAAVALAGAAAVLKLAVLAPPRVAVAGIERRTLAARSYGNGTVEAKVVVAVSSKITGRIVAVYADQGDEVRRGQLLARLESDEFEQQNSQSAANVEKAEAALKAETATLNKARAAVELANANAARYKALGDKGLVARIETEQYETAAKLAREEVARAEAAVELAAKDRTASRAGLGVSRSRLADTRVFAPVDGRVVSRDLEAGSTVTPGSPIFTIADPKVVWVKANVDEAALKGVVVGQEATISLRSAPGTTFPGRVARLGGQSDRVTEELEVDVAFTPVPKTLHLGEQAEVRILTEARAAAPSIPSAALTNTDRGKGVWTIRDGRVAFRNVKTGIEDRSGFTEIVEGLGGNDRVAVAPQPVLASFREGARVRTGK